MLEVTLNFPTCLSFSKIAKSAALGSQTDSSGAIIEIKRKRAWIDLKKNVPVRKNTLICSKNLQELQHFNKSTVTMITTSRLPLTLFLSAATFSGFSSMADAALVLDVDGTPGSGQSTWVFSGSATAVGGGKFQFSDGSTSDGEWKNIGDYTTVNDFDGGDGSMILSGSATITAGTDSRLAEFIYIDDDSATDGDDFAVNVQSSDLLYSDGETVSWSGTVVANIDILDLNRGAPWNGPVTLTGSNKGSGILPLEINVIPEPSGTLPLLCVLGMTIFGRRRS